MLQELHNHTRSLIHTQTRAYILKCQFDAAMTDDNDDEPCRSNVAVCFCFLGQAAGVDLRNLDPLPGRQHNVSTAALGPPRPNCQSVFNQKFNDVGGEMRS